MRKIAKIIFGISTSFFLIMTMVLIIRKISGDNEYLSLATIFNYFETYKGYQVLKVGIDEIQSLFNSDLVNFDFAFDFNNLNSFMNSIGNMFVSIGKMLAFAFNFVIGIINVPLRVIIYNVLFVIDFFSFILGF